MQFSFKKKIVYKDVLLFQQVLLVYIEASSLFLQPLQNLQRKANRNGPTCQPGEKDYGDSDKKKGH